MRIKPKYILLFALLCTAMLLLASCNNNQDAFAQAAANGCPYKITYDFGSGKANGSNTQIYMVQSGALLPELGVSKGTTAPVLSGYRLTGYYYTETDDEGNEVRKPWDFKTDRATGDLILHAVWERNFTVTIYYGEENASKSVVNFTEEKPSVKSFRQPTWAGHTFYGFYRDAAYTEPVTFPYEHGMNSENPNEVVYAKFLEGTYTIIRSPSDFKGTVNAGTKYYIDADIDMTGVKITVADIFSGSFIGNGHTIRGLSVTREQKKIGEYYGLFCEIASGAVFQDITFADVTVAVNLSNEQNTMVSHLGLFAGTVSEGAAFENVTVSGSMTYNCCGRDLTESLIVGDLFGESDGVDLTEIRSDDITVSEVTEE